MGELVRVGVDGVSAGTRSGSLGIEVDPGWAVLRPPGLPGSGEGTVQGERRIAGIEVVASVSTTTGTPQRSLSVSKSRTQYTRSSFSTTSRRRMDSGKALYRSCQRPRAETLSPWAPPP